MSMWQAAAWAPSTATGRTSPRPPVIEADYGDDDKDLEPFGGYVAPAFYQAAGGFRFLERELERGKDLACTFSNSRSKKRKIRLFSRGRFEGGH